MVACPPVVLTKFGRLKARHVTKSETQRQALKVTCSGLKSTSVYSVTENSTSLITNLSTRTDPTFLLLLHLLHLETCCAKIVSSHSQARTWGSTTVKGAYRSSGGIFPNILTNHRSSIPRHLGLRAVMEDFKNWS